MKRFNRKLASNSPCFPVIPVPVCFLQHFTSSLPLHSHQPVTDHKSLHYLQYHLRLRQHKTPRSNHFSSARCSISVSFQSLSKPRWQGGNWSHYMWWHILLWIIIWEGKNIQKKEFLWILLLTLILNNMIILIFVTVHGDPGTRRRG